MQRTGRRDRVGWLAGLLLATAALPGCRHAGNLFFPPLPESDARKSSRIELRVLSVADVEARNHQVKQVLKSLAARPETLHEIAGKLVEGHSNGTQPSDADRLRQQQVYDELERVHRDLDEIDRDTLAFRPRGKNEDHATHVRARSDFFACLGFVDPYEHNPSLDAFAPTLASEPGAPGLEAAALDLVASRHTARQAGLANSALTRRARPGSARMQQQAWLLELRRSFERGDREELALRLLYRIDFVENGQAFRLVPVYFWLGNTTVKVAGLQTHSARGAWGWLWPWMWGHALWGVFDDDLYAVEVDAQVEIDAIVSTTAERDALSLGGGRFALGRVLANRLPFERSCRDIGAELRVLPSPTLSIPVATADTLQLPIDVRITLAEHNRFGSRFGSLGGLFERDRATLDLELPAAAGFAAPDELTSDPEPPPPAEPGRP